MNRPKKSPDWQAEDGKSRRLWVPMLAMIIAVAVIVALAIYNLSGPKDDVTVAPDQANQQSAGESVSLAEAAPSFDVVRISRGGTGVLAGRAAPDSLVEVLVDGKVVADVRADRNGEWVMILEEPLETGTAEMSLRATLDGQQAVSSENVVVVAIPEPLVPERFAEREGEGVVAVLTSRSGEGGSRVMQKPGLAAPGEVGDSLAVDTIDFGANGQTVLSGRSLPRATIRIYLDNSFLVEVRSDDDGRWTAQSADAMVDGDHVLRVDQVLTEGEVQLRVEQPFTTGQALDPALAESRVVVQPGNTLWMIARKLYGRGTRFTMIFQENSEQIVDPDLIYPGQLFRFPDSEAGGAAEKDDETTPPTP
ncbi:peptidoglycan-binding protein LysM [Iodidimonas muriae]|uniref:Peptidoglycan-binding protein LysM n=1 Tax=Iodidimonas muriae TaxID=261467 RepID=A0ABQ2L6P7_9PROT|nr:LysM peptidoglycan-binding domain-containing protein [Iodidimonas muriae]GER06538.1 peptidoglycan-binding protein LysM [Kordiimonadales bacterium JCM 17843]GGO05191.1 peptidoglycan-binding protein LysM [Iodidimonas muriae]